MKYIHFFRGRIVTSYDAMYVLVVCKTLQRFHLLNANYTTSAFLHVSTWLLIHIWHNSFELDHIFLLLSSFFPITMILSNDILFYKKFRSIFDIWYSNSNLIRILQRNFIFALIYVLQLIFLITMVQLSPKFYRPFFESRQYLGLLEDNQFKLNCYF